MAHCEEYTELISASLDGALSPAEAERLRAHLAQCPECRALLEELTALRTALEELPPVEAPADLHDRIMAAVAAEQVIPFAPTEKKRPPIRWQKWLASAAVLAVVVAGTWSWKPWERTAPQGPAPAAGVQSDAAVQDQISEAAQAPLEEALPETAGSGDTLPDSGPRAKATQDSAESEVLPEDVYEKVDQDLPDAAVAPQEAAVPPRAGEPEAENGDGSRKPFVAMQAPAPASDPVPNLNQVPLESEPVPEAPQETLAPMLRSVLMTSALPQESQPLTAREALDRLLEEYPMPEEAQLVDAEDCPGWQTPLTVLEGETQQVSTRLEYLGLTANGKYHEFWLHNFLVDDPEIGLAHSSTLNFFAVSLEDASVLTQRPDPEEGLTEEEILAAYEAGIQAYLQATTE